MNKEDFVHKRNRDKGNFYSKDFTLEEVNQLIEDEKDAEKWRWNKKNCPSLTEAVEIVERLKKQLEYSKSLKDDEFQIRNHIIVILQKILGEKK